MILAILQARMSSSRLPGKVLRPILGVPMMLRQIERLRRSRLIEKLVVATSDQPEDDDVTASCRASNTEVRRGPLHDVVQRFHVAARDFSPDHVVRLTADCPLADWTVIDALIELHLSGNYDYTTNALPRSFPHGLDCEVMTGSALETVVRCATTPYEREHVTPYLYRHGTEMRVGSLENESDRSWLRWTVDTADDFSLVQSVYEALYFLAPAFTTQDVFDLMARRADLRFVNAASQSRQDQARARQFWDEYDTRDLARTSA